MSDYQLEHLAKLHGLKHRWWGLEPDFMLRNRVIRALEKSLYYSEAQPEQGNSKTDRMSRPFLSSIGGAS